MTEEPNMPENKLVLLPERLRQPQAVAIPADADPMSLLERFARDPSITLEKLRGLADMQREFRAEAAKAEFYSAFTAMQGDIPVISKNGEIKVDGKIRSTYARLEDIGRVIKPILQQHGFAITHKVRYGDKITVLSILMHKAGHAEETEFLAAADKSGAKNDIQALGSTISYGKRQNTKALLDIAEGGDDDDGHASGRAVLMTADHAATVTTKCEGISSGQLMNVLKGYKVEKLEQIADSEYERIVHRLDKIAKESAK